MIVTKEKFQDFEADESHSKFHGGNNLNQDGTSTTTFFIDENYMNNSMRDEETKSHVVDRSNQFSAAAAYSQNKQYDGFEILDDANSKKKDSDLLNEKVRGLLNSESIKIEEKGYLL